MERSLWINYFLDRTMRIARCMGVVHAAVDLPPWIPPDRLSSSRSLFTGHTAMDRIDPPSRDFAESLEKAPTIDEKLAVLRSHFHLEVVQTDHRFEDDAFYFIVGAGSSYLIATQSPAVAADHLHFRSCLHDTPMKPLALARLQATIQRQCVYHLQPKPIDRAERDQVLDIGAFGQLMDAAQRSGLVPGISTIIQIRDCEFRLGRHQQALQLMESMAQGFTGRAVQRTQRLAREEADIASGRIKMSPKELQAKRLRDNQQTQCIERARTRFSRVVEGLRTIVQRGL